MLQRSALPTNAKQPLYNRETGKPIYNALFGRIDEQLTIAIL
jgi:hypothetical protein